MINYTGFEEYLKNKNYAEKTIKNNISYIKRSIDILNKIDWFSGSDEQKIMQFAIQTKNFKKEFDKYHTYKPSQDSTFSNFRESAKKYKDYLITINSDYTKNFYGLWMSHKKQDAIEETIKTGIWKNNAKIQGTWQIEEIDNMNIGDDVFLYYSEKMVTISDSPFNNLLPNNYQYFDRQIVYVKCPAIGKIISKDIINSTIYIKWEENYKPRNWYIYFRQQGVWTLNKADKIELYNIVFNNQKQNYQLMIDKKYFKFDNIIKKEHIIVNTKNIILYGAPGVGKTHNYQRIISMLENKDNQKDIFNTITNNADSQKIQLDSDTFKNIKDDKRIEFVTFHQNYSYEDFIEGFRPNEDGNIKLEDGIFKNIVNRALEQQKNFYIVIDEINRGNISKIFGELITLIEEDKRDTYEVTLPYSKEKFKTPSNLYIIATMNSTDKSIATIDIALRRRFTFLKMKPNLELVDNREAKELMKNLNEYIKLNINEDYMLGHSYFMKVQNKDDLDFIKEYKIKPLLEEYFYTDDDKLKEVMEILNG